METKMEAKAGSLRDEFSRTARGELSRKRRRLGELTPEQERAVETLLISTTERISDLLAQQIERPSEIAESSLDEI